MTSPSLAKSCTIPSSRARSRKTRSSNGRANTIPARRLSSAQARGAAKGYAYYGTAEYRIEWSDKRQAVMARAVSAAPSTRRSLRLAERDIDEECERVGAVRIAGTAGELNLGDLEDCNVWFEERHG